MEEVYRNDFKIFSSETHCKWSRALKDTIFTFFYI